MHMDHGPTLNTRLIALVFGLVSILGISVPVSAASDYVVVSKKGVTMGDQGKNKPRRVIQFQLPGNYDSQSDVVLQMNLRGTDKSKYNAVYLNDFTEPDFEGCDSADKDRNKSSRIGYLPRVSNNQWIMYQKIISGNNLRAGSNTLMICSRNKLGDGRGGLDKFFVKDIVLHYHEVGTQETTEPASCSRVYNPVCGVDGRTYQNTCEADEFRVKVDYFGECTSSPTFCSSVFDPVCGVNGQTYDNACEADAAGVNVDHSGACTSSPTFCSSVYDPVCGVNGQTYDNACEADAAGVNVDHNGQCTNGI